MSGLYFDIGRKARDLLYKGYAHQPANHLQGFDCSLDLSCQIRDCLPGLRTLFNFSIPDSAKVELQYLSDYGGIAGGFGLKADPLAGQYSPLINVSGLLGSEFLSIGTDLAFDISTGTFNNFNAGLSFNSDFLIASFHLNDKLDTWKASCLCVTDPSTETAIAAELKHTFSANDTAITIGGQQALFPFTMVKARVDTHGRIGGLIRQELWEKIAITVAGDVDLFDIQGLPKIGMSMAFRL